MKAKTSLPIALCLLLSISCSTISRSDCKKDMRNMGLKQGQLGLFSLSSEIQRVCMRGESTVDLEGYEKGFAMGWSEYCTPYHGFENGKKGDVYKSFCPPEKEDLYREKFLVGKKIYEKKDQVIELEEKIKDLSSNSGHTLANKEELNKLNEYARGLERDIQALEQRGMSPVHTD
ncbi:MAG: DUF2799 domain-containing protein [Bacteriovorax sp.]